MTSDIAKALKALKGVGSKLGRGLIIESYLEFYPNTLVEELKRLLDQQGVTPEDVRQYVLNNQGIPIPQEAFRAMRGLDDYIETIEPGRIFEWFVEARPDLANELIKMGDLGAEYIVKFKDYLVDSIRNLPLEEEEEVEEEGAAPPPQEEDQEASHITEVSGIVYAGDVEAPVEAPPEPKTEPAKPPPDKTKKAPPGTKMKRLVCDSCGNTEEVTEEEAARRAGQPCPVCGK